jgi:hypothetical protein
MRTRHDQTRQDLAALTGLLQDLAGDMPPGHRQRLKDHLVTECRRAEPIRSPAPGGPRVTSPRGRLRRQARLILATGAALAGVAATVTAISITSQGGLPPPSPGAVQLLAKVADAAARQPTPHVRDSQYMYAETKVAMLFTPPGCSPRERPAPALANRGRDVRFVHAGLIPRVARVRVASRA